MQTNNRSTQSPRWKSWLFSEWLCVYFVYLYSCVSSRVWLHPKIHTLKASVGILKVWENITGLQIKFKWSNQILTGLSRRRPPDISLVQFLSILWLKSSLGFFLLFLCFKHYNRTNKFPLEFRAYEIFDSLTYYAHNASVIDARHLVTGIIMGNYTWPGSYRVW